MQDYTFNDFMQTLDDTDRYVAERIYNHISNHYSEYKPFNIRPMNKAKNKWQMNFRKKPEHGKAFCSMYSVDGALSIRVIGSGFMNYELLLRQKEFAQKVRQSFIYNFCKYCGKKCYYEFREFWFIGGELVTPANFDCKLINKPEEYVGVIDDYDAINNLNENDVDDLLQLLDIQAKHIVKPKNIKNTRGNGYAEINKKRCGDVSVVSLKQVELDIDDFELSDYCDTKRLNKYASEYALTPMGVNDGLWFYHDTQVVCGELGNDYNYTEIQSGKYATVSIRDPFSFSAWRVWIYIAGWMRENGIKIRQVKLGEMNIPFFTKFYRQDDNEYMAVYVPINEEFDLGDDDNAI